MFLMGDTSASSEFKFMKTLQFERHYFKNYVWLWLLFQNAALTVRNFMPTC